MALTPTEEELVRNLLDQQAAILSLARNEATITSKLGATKATLSDLNAASAVGDTDLFLTRQGTTDKSVTAQVLRNTLQHFTQSGIGAVTRTLHSKLEESFTVTDFGADPDGIADSTSSIQAAHDAAVAAGTITGFVEVCFPAGTYLITSLNWSPLVRIKCLGAVVLKSSISSGKCIYVSTRFGNWDTIPKQLYYSANQLVDGKLTLHNTNGKGVPAIGIFFGDDGVEAYSAESISIDNVNVYGWSKGLAFGSHAYNIAFNHCKFMENGSDIYVSLTNGVDTYIDSYERMNFTDCVFAGADNVMDGDVNWHGDWMFNCCSFDAMTRFNTNKPMISVINHVNCHYEWIGTETIINANSAFNITNPYFVKVHGTNATPLIANISSVFKLINPTYITPTGVTLFDIVSAQGQFFGESIRKQYGDQEAVYCANSGGGKVSYIVTKDEFVGTLTYNESSVTLPNGLIIKTGTFPTTAVDANSSVNVPITFNVPFPNAQIYGNASAQPNGSFDFYGLTQVINPSVGGFTATFRNGAYAQDIINGRWFALGF